MSGSLNKLAPEIIRSGIFDKISNFSEFVDRVSKTKEFNNRGIQKTKGDIFEIFSEALLNVDKRFQAKKVYPQGYVPAIILKKLRMYGEDYGYDGLYITNDNKYIIYQSKFRSKDEKINWQGKNGLSSFIGVSNYVHNHHLISSTSNITKYFSDRENVLMTLENDLNNLNSTIFIKIENWLKNKAINSIGLHTPDKHQKIALEKINKELSVNTRTTVVMACGTGKTDVGFWYYRKQNPNLALVLVPSIALVKQIRSDWLSQITNDVVTFQLCSSKDTSKRDDEYIIEKKDLGMTIETDPKILRNWLIKFSNKKKIIFSTYQSSRVLKKSLKKNQKIDLAIFDEAHRTATVKKNIDSNFNFALFDENIPIKKRLFMTATRRILSNKQIDKSGSGKVLVSMDQEEIYGKICFNLSFYEASKKYKAIARPRIILQEVLSSEIDEYKTKVSASDVKGEKIKSEYLATQISLKKAINKTKTKKIFCFHNTVSQSKTFTNGNTPESIGHHLKDFYVDYVSGSMRMNLRDNKMQLFKSYPKSILSNARCLIEGVDVPTVGMVAFISPKRSEIDIVQAIGRALRNRSDPNKKFGYVHVPIFINKFTNQKMADAIEKSKFENLILIIKALKEHDSEISQIIKEVLISETRGKGFSKKALKSLSEFIECSHSIIPKKLLLKCIKSKIIHKIRTKWDEMIGRFLAFKDKYSHPNITSEYDEFKDLYEWTLIIRRLHQKNKLLKFQIDELNNLNFPLQDHRVSIHNIKKFKTLSQLEKKFNVEGNVIKALIKNKKIVSVGKGFKIGIGVVDLYKDINLNDFLKLAEIDFLPNKNLVTAKYLSNKFGIGRDTFGKTIGDYSKGLTITSSSAKKEDKKRGYGVSPVFKNYSANEIKKLFNVDFIKPDKDLLTSAQLAKSLGGQRFYRPINKLIKEKKIKKVGRGFGTNGIMDFYKPISKQKYKNLMKIDILIPDKFFTLKQLCKKINLDISFLKKYTHHLDFVGMGTAAVPNKKDNTILGTTEYYKNITRKDLFKKLGVIEKNDKLFMVTNFNREIKKKFGSEIRDLNKKIKIAKILPAGKVISNTTESEFSNVYKMINKKQFLDLKKIVLKK